MGAEIDGAHRASSYQTENAANRAYYSMMVAAALLGWLLTLLGLVVAGCATPDTVMMRNRQTGEIAQCAAAYRSLVDGLGYRRQGDCITHYEGKGFERDLAPAGEK